MDAEHIAVATPFKHGEIHCRMRLVADLVQGVTDYADDFVIRVVRVGKRIPEESCRSYFQVSLLSGRKKMPLVDCNDSSDRAAGAEARISLSPVRPD